MYYRSRDPTTPNTAIIIHADCVDVLYRSSQMYYRSRDPKTSNTAIIIHKDYVNVLQVQLDVLQVQRSYYTRYGLTVPVEDLDVLQIHILLQPIRLRSGPDSATLKSSLIIYALDLYSSRSYSNPIRPEHVANLDVLQVQAYYTQCILTTQIESLAVSWYTLTRTDHTSYAGDTWRTQMHYWSRSY